MGVHSLPSPVPQLEDSTSDLKPDEMRSVVLDDYAKVSAGKGRAGVLRGDADRSVEDDRLLARGARTAARRRRQALGCGNPQATAALKPGDTVLDLGPAAASTASSQRGREAERPRDRRRHDAIAGDARAEQRAHRGPDEPRLLGQGRSHLSVTHGSVDVNLSNCMINLSPSKATVFREAFRGPRIGGRLAMSHVVAIAVIPVELRTQAVALSGCISGAAPIEGCGRRSRTPGSRPSRSRPHRAARRSRGTANAGRRPTATVVGHVVSNPSS